MNQQQLTGWTTGGNLRVIRQTLSFSIQHKSSQLIDFFWPIVGVGLKLVFLFASVYCDEDSSFSDN